jgi:pimeloyl-ACP methyl ester carboxylesterase
MGVRAAAVFFLCMHTCRSLGATHAVGNATDNFTWPDELADNTTCLQAGLSDEKMRSLMFQLALPNRYERDTTQKLFLPFFSSCDFLSGSCDAKLVVVWMHGLSANANAYYCNGVMAAHQEHVTDVLHVAPWFGSQQVTASTWGGVSAQKVQAANVSAYWGDGEWQQGTDNTPSPSNYTTAFDALETLLSTLLEKKSLPNLERITFVGFSAGAQLLSRWAYFSSVTLLFRPAESNVHVRYIAGDPSSYVYLDELRPEPSCAALESTGADHKCNKFVAPTDNDTAACPGYNVYKYGLHFREPGDMCTCDTCATCNSYVEAFARNKQLLASVTSAFALQDLRFLLGNQVTAFARAVPNAVLSQGESQPVARAAL